MSIKALLVMAWNSWRVRVIIGFLIGLGLYFGSRLV